MFRLIKDETLYVELIEMVNSIDTLDELDQAIADTTVDPDDEGIDTDPDLELDYASTRIQLLVQRRKEIEAL